MDDDRLMELVEANDILYNKAHRYNHSFERKKRVWNKIAAEMDHPVDDLIKRYRTLRDRFVRYKRVEMLTGSENKYHPPIMDKMEFLTPHVFVKSSNGEKITWTCREDDSSSNQIITSGMTPEQQDHEESDTLIEMAYSSPERQLYKSAIKRKAPEIISTPGGNYDGPTAMQPNNNMSAADEAFREALQSFKKLCKAREERQENEALHGFGQMIVATIAGMSPSKQTKAMMRVTELVMCIRMEDDD
ncbi:uncharacterized protein LOC142226679 [Haematobia irritans]|uniref:uncharacterized protein LOC142226679 n=1 Tax=Haematobia irritans TaxID=7368 RepID=UPI003F4FB1CB